MATYVRQGPSTIYNAGRAKMYCVDLEVGLKFMAITCTVLGVVLLLTGVGFMATSVYPVRFVLLLLLGVLHTATNGILIMGVLKRSKLLVGIWIVCYLTQIILFFLSIAIVYFVLISAGVFVPNWNLFVILGSIYYGQMSYIIQGVWKFFKQLKYEEKNPELVSQQYILVPGSAQPQAVPYPQSQMGQYPQQQTVPYPQPQVVPYTQPQTALYPQQQAVLSPQLQAVPSPQQQAVPSPQQQAVPHPEPPPGHQWVLQPVPQQRNGDVATESKEDSSDSLPAKQT